MCFVCVFVKSFFCSQRLCEVLVLRCLALEELWRLPGEALGPTKKTKGLTKGVPFQGNPKRRDPFANPKHLCFCYFLVFLKPEKPILVTCCEFPSSLLLSPNKMDHV